MRRGLLLPLLALSTACSPPARQIVAANSIIPVPAPSAPLSHWSATATRIPKALEVPGATLRGWSFYSLAGSSQKLPILFFNGNAMTIDESQSLYQSLAVRGADVTAFDYRGYGFSTGQPDVMDFRRDSLALYDNLAASGPVVVYGFSMGTAMATYVASQRRVAGLILAGTIASAQEEFPVFARAQGNAPAKIANMTPSADAIAAFDETNLILFSSAPLLVLHGETDRLVPIHEGREVFAASPARQKNFIAIPEAGHNETISSPQALQAVRVFLSSIHPK
jgi:pimeloyl-ACP methyl ester carboxylesterase